MAPPVIQFGIGLIGQSIAEKLQKRSGYAVTERPSPWSDPQILEKHRQVVLNSGLHAPPPERVEVIWSAGSAGFAIDDEAAGKELDTFVQHLDWLEDWSGTLGIPLNFNLISSAGGLFEGQRLIQTDSEPSPRRPYGHLKLNMEHALKERTFHTTRILRVTTVFGYVRPNQRRGLITALIENGVRGRTTPIFGTLATLRDYIFTEDIASFLVRELFAAVPKPGSATTLLAAGKPSSIGEIINLVEATIKQKILLQCSLAPTNLAHITYEPPQYPEGFEITSLPAAISTIYRDYHTRF